MADNICSHLAAITEVKIGSEHMCEECMKINSPWTHLRTCQTRGVTLCCDESPNTHMTRHHFLTGHPVVASAEPGEHWLWCYLDDLLLEY